ncbi:LOW QUALITY PROTEIN: hypothetical protein CFOL_v3_15962, partial [Cephalotus follicularis]
IQWPAPLRSSAEKRKTEKYYRYHRDHGYDTENCRHLKNQIKDLIGKGYLRNYVDKNAPQERRESRKAYGRQSLAVQQIQHSKRLKTRGDEEVISFSEVDYKGVRLPHDDPVVVTLLMELFTMKRILINSGSSNDILYKHAFDQLRISTDQLKLMKTPLVSFAGERVHPLGSIYLSVVAGMAPRTQVKMTFLVVDTPSPYSAIIRHPGLNLMEA